CGERTTLALSIRAPDKLSPFRLRDVGRLRRAPQVTEVLAGRVARAPSPAKIPSMQPRPSRSCALGRARLQSLPRATPKGAKPPPSCHSEALRDGPRLQPRNARHSSPPLGHALSVP